VYRSVEKWGAKVEAPISNLGEYVDIAGFEVTGSGDGILNGDGAFASHSRIYDNHVHDLGPRGGCASCGNGIISVGWTSAANYQGTDVEIFRNVIHGITQASTPGHVHGIYISHPYAKIYDNVVYDVDGGWGIHGWHNANFVEVRDNEITDTSLGIVMGNGDSPCDSISCNQEGYVVTGNVMCNNGRGIDLRGSGHTNDGNAFFNTPPSGTNQRVADCG
jgi:hypothetical protein